MDIQKLEIENFCTYGKCEIELSNISSAIIIGKIRGSDKSSNGCGKSTIFAAIRYVLFSECEFSSIDKLIRHNMDFCRVALNFYSSSDGEQYRIERSRSKKNTDVRLFKWENEKWEDKTQRRATDTEKEIAKIIKINGKAFMNTVYFSQTDLGGIGNLTAEKRKSILRDILQLATYAKLEKIAKSKLEGMVKENDRKGAILNSLGNPVEDVSKYIKELEEISLNISSKTEMLNIFDENLNQLNEKYSELYNKFSDAEKSVSQSILLKNKLNNEIQKIELDFKKILNNKKNIENEINDLLKRKIIKEKELNKVEIKLSSEDINKRLKEIDNNLVEIKSEIKKEMDKYEKLNIPFPETDFCLHCRQKVIQEDKEKHRKQVDQEIKDIKNNVNKLRAETSKLDIEKTSLNIEIISIGKIKELNNSILIIENDISAKSNLMTEYESILKKNDDLLQIKNNELKEILENQNILLTDEYIQMKEDISSFKINILAKNQERKILISSVELIGNKKSVLEYKIEQRKKDEEKLILLKQEMEEIDKKISIHLKVCAAFGSKGIPSLLVQTVLDQYVIEVNEMLNNFRPGLQVEFLIEKEGKEDSDTLDINYILDGVSLEYAQLSCAQKMIVSVALKLGLLEVLKNKMGSDLKFLLFDETDHPLDENGLVAFEDIIKKLQNNYKILIISHNNDLKARFSTRISVEQNEDNISVAKILN